MVNLQPAATPVTAPSGSTAAQPTLTPATPQPVTHQLAGPVLNLRASGDGSHQLTIALHPAELGPVNLHVRILGDSMAIQLSSTSEGAHDAMRDALPQLRHELEAAGLSSVDLSLDLGASTSGGSAGSGGAADSRGQGDGARSNANPDQARATTQPHRDDRPRANPDSGLDRWL
jgi:flagellar hook-length control protein FliK